MTKNAVRVYRRLPKGVLANGAQAPPPHGDTNIPVAGTVRARCQRALPCTIAIP